MLRCGLAAAALVAAPRVVRADARPHRWRLLSTWPRSFPILSVGAAAFAAAVTQISDGRIQVEVIGASESVPAAAVLAEVAAGRAALGYGAPAFWPEAGLEGPAPVLAVASGIPFGPDSAALHAWHHQPEIRAILARAWRRLGVVAWPAGDTGAQVGGWLRVPLPGQGADALAGLRLRFADPPAAAVLRAVGAVVPTLAAGEVLGALQRQQLDGAEWAGPHLDTVLGLPRVAPVAMIPGWQAPAAAQWLILNAALWDDLPASLQQAVMAAAAQAWSAMVTAAARLDALAWARIAAHARGVPAPPREGRDPPPPLPEQLQIRRWSRAQLSALAQASDDLLAALAARDRQAALVLPSLQRLGRAAQGWRQAWAP